MIRELLVAPVKMMAPNLGRVVVVRLNYVVREWVPEVLAREVKVVGVQIKVNAQEMVIDGLVSGVIVLNLPISQMVFVAPAHLNQLRNRGVVVQAVVQL